MTREEALTRYDRIRYNLLNSEDKAAVDVAFEALREQGNCCKNGNSWISVEDRLPEAFVSVLVYMPEERPLPTVHEGYVTKQGNWYAHFFEREPFEVTHWMPMPTPPEEDT